MSKPPQTTTASTAKPEFLVPGLKHFTAANIAALNAYFELSGPRTPRGVNKALANTLGGTRSGSERVICRHQLPSRLLKCIENWECQESLSNYTIETTTSVALRSPQPPPEIHELTNKQRAVMDSRLVVISYLHELDATVGKRAAISTFIAMQEAGSLPDYVVESLQVANAKSKGQATVGRSTLSAWRSSFNADGATALASKRYNFAIFRPWHAPLLQLYQESHQNQSIAKMVEYWDDYNIDIDPPPNARAAQRFLESVPDNIKGWQKRGLNARRATGPYASRIDPEGLKPMDVVMGDGHLFNAYIRHPETGRPFRPEICVYIDALTRRPVGWSIWHAESEVGVRLAIAKMIANPEFGVPALHYSDNGPGYKSKLLLATLTRLGITITNSIPGNPQARGRIERFNSAVLIPLAKTFDTYCGPDGDQEAFRKKYGKAKADGSSLPTYEDLYVALEKAFERHNNRPHSSLGGKTPLEMWEERKGKEHFEPIVLDSSCMHDLLPAYERKCRRCLVQLPWGQYFSKDLDLYHDRDVLAHYVPGDGSRIWVADLKGRLLAIAERDANARDIFPQNQLQDAIEKRTKGQLLRLDRRREEIEEERRSALPDLRLEHYEELTADASTVDAELIDAPNESAIPVFDEDDYEANQLHMRRWLDLDEQIKAGQAISDQDRLFYDEFKKTRAHTGFLLMGEDPDWTWEQILGC